jgi:hypothetical protein
VLCRESAFDMHASLFGKWCGTLTGATGEQAAAS